MRSLIAGAAGLLLFVIAGVLLSSGAGFKTERILISGNSSPFLVSKPDMRFGQRFEVDYGYQTTFEITSTANQPVSFQIDGSPSGEPCRIRFTDPGTKVCQSKVVTIPNDGSPTKLFASGESMWPQEYYWDMFGAPLYSSAVMVGTVGGVLVPIDPDLEVERDYTLVSLIAALVAVLSLGLAWRWRKQPER
jgi:hypothetical protein